jgi:hypothetical protein
MSWNWKNLRSIERFNEKIDELFKKKLISEDEIKNKEKINQKIIFLENGKKKTICIYCFEIKSYENVSRHER